MEGSVQLANNAINVALDSLVKAEAKVNRLGKLAEEYLKDPVLSKFYLNQQTVALNQLENARAYHLQLISSAHQVSAIVDIPQVYWTVAPGRCPWLEVKDDDKLITLPPYCVDGAGIGSPNQALILYRRPALVQQWNEINRCSIRTYARLWVVGPPGTGKSCAALAFAWTINREHWDVIWIHYSRDDKHFNCVWLEGTKKTVCVVNEESVERDLGAILNTTSHTRKTIVFLDGYVKSSKAGEEAHLKCLRWHQKDKIKHRLVCVCSMVSVGKEFRRDLYPLIPPNVDLGHSDMEDVEMLPGELHNLETNAANEILADQTSELDHTMQAPPVHTQMVFKLTSWRFDEYKEAVLNDNFFYNVFPTYARQVHPNERIKLLREKYFVAGGSARLMFELTTETAIEALDEALAEAPNIETYLEGFVGDSSSGVINRLLARYDSPHGYDIRLVSEYVVRAFAITMGPRLLENFARACNVNPVMDGFILEAWFFAELTHNDLKWSEYVDSLIQEHQWPKSSIVFFDPMKYPIAISMNGPTWMSPIKWKLGGYDAVFVDKTAKLVRFVQVTRAESHAFKPEYFVDLLLRLLGDMNQVAVIELYFVVPLIRLPNFALAVSEQDFRTKVLQVVFTSRGSRGIPDQTFQSCNVVVKAIGVNYKIADRHPQ